MSPLLNLFPNQMSDRLWVKCHISKHLPISLLSSFPHGVDEWATCLSSFLFDNTRKSTIPPRINSPSQLPREMGLRQWIHSKQKSSLTPLSRSYNQARGVAQFLDESYKA
jgi:hypothetical protein